MMRSLLLSFLVVASPLLAQEPAAPAATTAPPEVKVEQTASPTVVEPLVKELGISPKQAEGAAGLLFGVAKSRLNADDFAKVAGAVPNMTGLLAAAPKPDAKTAAVAALTGSSAAGGVAAMAGAVSSMSKLGLKAETIALMTPALVKVVEKAGGAQVGALLAGALK